MEKQKIKIHLQFDKQSRKWVDKTNTYWTLQGDSRNIKRFHLSQVVYISHIVKWFVFIWIVLYIYLKFKLKRKGKRTICSQIYYHTVHTSHNILHLFQYKSFNYELHYLFVEKTFLNGCGKNVVWSWNRIVLLWNTLWQLLNKSHKNNIWILNSTYTFKLFFFDSS